VVTVVNFAPVAPTAFHVKAEFTEWDVPASASRPSHPLAASDGSIWYTAEAANALGRLDPNTGEIREFQIKTPQSGPQGLAEDASGNIWYAADSKGQLGKLDPKTGTITEYPISNATGRDPRAPVADQKGNLWFTVRDGNMIGRFSSAGAAFTLRPSPTPKSLPEGITVNSKGVPFFAEAGSNKVASVDPATMAVHEFVIPDSAARPRRIAIDSKDIVWFTDSARGYLGRLDPTTGSVKEWASPGGVTSVPYAIAAIGADVWFSQSGTTPNTLVRFEPATERFQTWNIPSGGGPVEGVSVTRDGNLVLTETDANRVALVTLIR